MGTHGATGTGVHAQKARLVFHVIPLSHLAAPGARNTTPRGPAIACSKRMQQWERVAD
jgi:hypothetical protein